MNNLPAPVSAPPTQHYLHLGEMYFSREAPLVTLLGSCVAITLWYPESKLGAMCHFVLPKRPSAHHQSELDGRYGNEAWQWLSSESIKRGERLDDAQIGIYGGAQTFMRSGRGLAGAVGARNLEMAHLLLTAQGLRVATQETGGSGGRMIRFCVKTGQISCRVLEPIELLRKG